MAQGEQWSSMLLKVAFNLTKRNLVITVITIKEDAEAALFYEIFSGRNTHDWQS